MFAFGVNFVEISNYIQSITYNSISAVSRHRGVNIKALLTLIPLFIPIILTIIDVFPMKRIPDLFLTSLTPWKQNIVFFSLYKTGVDM